MVDWSTNAKIEVGDEFITKDGRVVEVEELVEKASQVTVRGNENPEVEELVSPRFAFVINGKEVSQREFFDMVVDRA